jgi:hypothetical protein
MICCSRLARLGLWAAAVAFGINGLHTTTVLLHTDVFSSCLSFLSERCTVRASILGASAGGLVAALFLMLSLARAGTPFIDGNFVAPVPKPGTFAALDTGERYGEWRVVGAVGFVAFVSGSYTHNGIKFLGEGTSLATQQNSVYVNLAAISRSATGIAHAPMATVVGQSYTVTLWVGNVVDPSGIYGTTSTVNIYENAKLIGKATNSAGGGAQQTWEKFSITFIADAPWTTMAFINGDPPNDMSCGIANIGFGVASTKTVSGAGRN